MKINFLQPVVNAMKRALRAPAAGRAITLDASDRFYHSYSGSLTPEKLARIFNGAESGDVRELHVLGAEIEEKNWTIKHALQTRSAAVNGTPWEIIPGSDSKAAAGGAELFKQQLLACGDEEIESFDALLEYLSVSAYLGAAASEIIWGPGGEIKGFSSIPVGNITFPDWALRLSGNTGDIEMPQAKFVTILRRSVSGDPSRAGLVRTLAWLHCFMSVGFKDLLGFIERCGMPFIVANVNEKSWNEDRDKIQGLIRNFGSHGGGVFSDGVKLNMLQAANSTGQVYFKLLEYIDAAITKVLLGQTASSSDGGGLSGDNAQSQVRQDLTESDCRAVANSVNTCIAAPWARFNMSANEQPPRFQFVPFPGDETKKYNAQKSQFDSLGVAIRGGILTATPAIERRVREVLDLPVDDKDMDAEWKKIGGVRRPITLQQEVESKTKENFTDAASGGSFVQPPAGFQLEGSETTALSTFNSASAGFQLEGSETTALSTFNSSNPPQVLETWAGDLLKKIADAADDESGEKIKSLGDAVNFGLLKTAPLQGLIENTVYAAAANGAASKADELSKKIQGENSK